MAKKRSSFTPAAGLFNKHEEITDIEVSNKEKEQFSEGVTGTQGRKGKRARRMNVPVTDEEYEAIRRGSRSAGLTYGEYIYEAVKFYRLHEEGKENKLKV